MYRANVPPASICPRCGETLVAGTYAGGTLAMCRRCGGVRLDAPLSERALSRIDRELAQLSMDASLSARLTPSLGEPLTCHECGRVMERVTVRAAVCEVDLCPDHGMWFDAAELANTMRAFATAKARVGPLAGRTIERTSERPKAKYEPMPDFMGPVAGFLQRLLYRE